MDFSLQFNLIVLIPAKNLGSILFASPFKWVVVILPSADQHVHYNVWYSLRLFGALRASESIPHPLAFLTNSWLSSLF